MLRSTLLALSTVAGSVNAYIYSISTPPAVIAGQSLPVTLNTSIYIQNYDDFGIIWGVTDPRYTCDGCVGRKIGYTNLVGDGAPEIPPSGSFTLDVLIPELHPKGDFVFVAGIPYLVGASGVTDIKYFNSSITIS